MHSAFDNFYAVFSFDIKRKRNFDGNTLEKYKRQKFKIFTG